MRDDNNEFGFCHGTEQIETKNKFSTVYYKTLRSQLIKKIGNQKIMASNEFPISIKTEEKYNVVTNMK